MKDPDLLCTAAFVVFGLLGLGYALTIVITNLVK